MPKPKCFTIRTGKVICDKSSGAKRNYDDKKVNPECSKRKGKWTKGCYGKDKPRRSIMQRAKAPARRPPTRKPRKTTTKKKVDKPKPKPKPKKVDKPKPKPKPKKVDKPKPKPKPKKVDKPKPKPKKVEKPKRIPKPTITLNTWYRDESVLETFIKYVADQSAIIAKGPPYRVFPVGKVSKTRRNKEKKGIAYTRNEMRVDIPKKGNPILFYRNKLVPVKGYTLQQLEKAEKAEKSKPKPKAKPKAKSKPKGMFDFDSDSD